MIDNEEQRIVCKTREEPRKYNIFKNKNIMRRNIKLNKNSNNGS